MRSIWQREVRLPMFPKLKGSRKTDVLIIGGGIAGILTAYFLKQNGVKCMLLEKGRICHGTTAGTTAKLTIQHGLIYGKLLKKYGAEHAWGYLKANQLALDEFRRLCGDIECGFEIKDNYIYSLNGREKLDAELSALGKIGYRAELCEQLPLPFKNAAAVRFLNQAQFQPLEFIASIAEELPIYECSFVRELRENTAITAHASVSAENIIVTTHFPFINKHGSYFLKLYQHRSYMLALDNAPNLNGMYMDESKTGISFRNYKNYLLLGGGGHRTGKQGGSWNELRRFAEENYPRSEIICQWAAQDCMSLDDKPYIGEYSGRTSRLFTASGFNKWGMTGSMLSAMLLSDAVCGRRNEFAEIFNPSRSIMTSQLLINGYEAVKNLLTVSEKRCPHLGCALKWNKAEHSWDCACHGSRFDKNGKVLNNPANGNLMEGVPSDDAHT